MRVVAVRRRGSGGHAPRCEWCSGARGAGSYPPTVLAPGMFFATLLLSLCCVLCCIQTCSVRYGITFKMCTKYCIALNPSLLLSSSISAPGALFALFAIFTAKLFSKLKIMFCFLCNPLRTSFGVRFAYHILGRPLAALFPDARTTIQLRLRPSLSGTTS